jgi:hypothetical protein
MRNIEKSLDELYNYIAHIDQINTAVSVVNVGWHIEHSSLVIIKIIETVSKSDPKKYKWKFNIKRSFVFFLEKFPRGKAKAPDIVIPKQTEKTDFPALLIKTKEAIKKLDQVDHNQYFLHHVFGDLNKKNTFIMLDIHTKHHLQIIKDIIAA